MLLSTLAKATTRKRTQKQLYLFSRSFSNLLSKSKRPSFGIAFDIDGVIIRGETPIAGSPRALRRLYDHSGSLRIPYIFLTNGGGVPESRRALQLSKLLGVNISPLQVVQGHTPFRHLVNRFENDLVIAVGKGEPATVISEYGFKNVLSIDEYASYFDGIDPLERYKMWTTNQPINKSKNLEMAVREKVTSQRVKAAFIVSDSVDWSRDIQVLCDILRTGGLPGRELGIQPHLYFASDDLAYQATFPSERLGMGAFRIALEAVFNRIHPNALEYTSFGKPNPSVFKNAETILEQVAATCFQHNAETGDKVNVEIHNFKRLYMIGDNPSVDIKGAQQAGHPWFSILTRMGVFRGTDNHCEFPADLVVNTVEDAVEYILEKEFT